MCRKRIQTKLAKINADKVSTICLIMIVKNESHIICRLLDSLVTIIDYISIVDTGSTDNTEELVRSWAAERNIPCHIEHKKFVNFAVNRSHSFTVARRAFPQADYGLLSDADFKWEVNNFSKRGLTADCYHVLQYNNYIRYYNLRLLKMTQDWVCEGVTHEYWKSNHKNWKTDKIHDTLVINDIGDGGAKDDKYERDERLLKDAIAKGKTSHGLLTRYHFYLAQTYFHQNMYREAIEWYLKRSTMGGFDEEVYYSYYVIGECYQYLTEYDKAEQYYLKAHHHRPTRAECLWRLAKMLIDLKNYDRALEVAVQGATIPYPDDLLFVWNESYGFVYVELIHVIGKEAPELTAAAKTALVKILATEVDNDKQVKIQKMIDELAQLAAA